MLFNPTSIMSLFRTYRVLPLLVGLALLVGVAAPTVQAVCAMMPGETQEASLPCHGHEEAGPTLNAQKDSASAPCCASLSERLHPCCHVEAAPRSSATILSDAAPRLLASATTAVLPDGMPTPSVVRSALLETKPSASSFTATPLRQALLSTFLI